MTKNVLIALLFMAMSHLVAAEINDQEMVTVPAGEFEMGCNHSRYDEICERDAFPAHKVFLDAYQIDKYEVSFRRYKKCVDDGKCGIPDSDGACNWAESWKGNHPANCVDWSNAKKMCEFEGKRLPTEAEWEKAARGIQDKRIFPWGDTPPSYDNAVMNQKVAGQTMGPGCGSGTTRPIGSKPAGVSPYGAHDMAGNVWEWVSDWFDEDYYQKSPNKNPKGPASGTYRTVRGGDWLMRKDVGLTSHLRHHYSPAGRGYVIGWRCAKSM